MKTLEISINGKQVEVLAQKIAGEIWFHYEGATHKYVPKAMQSHGAGAAGVQDPTQITAPMPGKIIKIFVKANQQVAEGETVIAMEAMKMEYNLKATKKMVINEIRCKEAEAVSLGAVLVTLGEIDE